MAADENGLRTDMLERFRECLSRSGLIAPGCHVLLGYSGGADSTCLLHLLKDAGIDVVAAHLHHSQRPEADEELLKCEEVCQSLGVPFVSGKADVPAIAKHRKMGIEEAGREARYEFFRMAAAQAECGLIATAHTRTDLIETVLLNIVRGSGLAGIAGIPARRENIVRPLLDFSRDETRAYCRYIGVWTHDDPANEDLSFSRARIRHRVLPELRAINASLEENLARLSAIAGEEDRFLDAAAARALESCEIPLNGKLRFLTIDCEAAFDREKLLHLPDVLLRRAVRLSVESLGASWDYAGTVSIVEALRTETKGSFTAEGGHVVLEWSDDTMHVRELEEIEPFRFPLSLPGETDSEVFGWTLSAWHSAAQRIPKRDDLEVTLLPGSWRGPLYFRSAQIGDKMAPLGFQSERKLSDLLSEAKLTPAARKRLPIVCDVSGPLWAPGICLRFGATSTSSSDSTDASKTTKNRDRIEQNASEKALTLKFGPKESSQ